MLTSNSSHAAGTQGLIRNFAPSRVKPSDREGMETANNTNVESAFGAPRKETDATKDSDPAPAISPMPRYRRCNSPAADNVWVGTPPGGPPERGPASGVG